MQYERDELIRLARVFLADAGIPASRLSREIFGADKLFARLFAGDDCLSESARIASRWFDEHWPLHLDWPRDVPRARGLYVERERLRDTRSARARRDRGIEPRVRADDIPV